MRFLRNLFVVFTLLSVAGLFYSSKRSRQLPQRSNIDRRLYKAPVQTMTGKRPFSVSCDGKVWKIEPLRNYEIYGLVVSYNDSEAFADYTHDRWGDAAFNFHDLGLIWGRNLVTDSYRNIKFSSGSFQLFWSGAHKDWQNFYGDCVSNNHVISDKAEIKDKITAVEIGDQVRLKGYLCCYSDGNGFRRSSSLIRTDNGNGACETIYVTDFEIIKTANEEWRLLNFVLWWLLPVVVVLLIYLTLNTPIKLNF